MYYAGSGLLDIQIIKIKGNTWLNIISTYGKNNSKQVIFLFFIFIQMIMLYKRDKE